GWEAGDLKCAGGQASQYSSTSAGINTSYSEPALGTNGVPGDDSSTGGLGWESGFYFTGGNGGWKCEGCSCTDYGYGGGGGGSYISGSSSGWTGGEHAGAGKVEITQIKYKNCNSSCDGFSDTTCQ
ncbi:hypothetical protein J6Z19_06350, partial [bacterium]|nr:hypothetical protein [bacterium]